MENWTEVDWIEGYRGVLEVSDHGNVRRKAYTYEATGRWGTPHTTSKPSKTLYLDPTSHGYHQVAVQIDGKRRKFLVHRLVGRAFVPGYAEGLTINHINGVKTDNRASNLEWVTLSVNTKKQWETGLVNTRGDSHHGRKLHSGKVRIIRRLLSLGATGGELSVLCDVDPQVIYGIKSGKRWSSVE
jgi:hypothetical protein